MKKSCEGKNLLCRCRGWFVQGAQRATSQVLGIGLFLLLSSSTVSADTGKASWYSTEACRVNSTKRCLTADGSSLYALEKKAKRGEGFAASYKYPLGTRIKVTNLSNHKSVTLRVHDRGPNKRLGRLVDLDRFSFERLEDPKKGVVKVEVTKL